jgi:L-aspartate oxidase
VEEQVLVHPSVRHELSRAMTAGAGVLRSETSLAMTTETLDALATRRSDEPCPPAWEATGLLAVARALTAAALRREETRGAHWREDFPETSDAWRGSLVTTLSGTVFEPAPQEVGT